MSRKFHVLPQGEPNSNINITPLVDVVLVLLIRRSPLSSIFTTS